MLRAAASARRARTAANHVRRNDHRTHPVSISHAGGIAKHSIDDLGTSPPATLSRRRTTQQRTHSLHEKARKNQTHHVHHRCKCPRVVPQGRRRRWFCCCRSNDPSSRQELASPSSKNYAVHVHEVADVRLEPNTCGPRSRWYRFCQLGADSRTICPDQEDWLSAPRPSVSSPGRTARGPRQTRGPAMHAPPAHRTRIPPTSERPTLSQQ